jgi:hypothetical protein
MGITASIPIQIAVVNQGSELDDSLPESFIRSELSQ